jgi:hypothetical protein
VRSYIAINFNSIANLKLISKWLELKITTRGIDKGRGKSKDWNFKQKSFKNLFINLAIGNVEIIKRICENYPRE